MVKAAFSAEICFQEVGGGGRGFVFCPLTSQFCQDAFTQSEELFNIRHAGLLLFRLRFLLCAVDSDAGKLFTPCCYLCRSQIFFIDFFFFFFFCFTPAFSYCVEFFRNSAHTDKSDIL